MAEEGKGVTKPTGARDWSAAGWNALTGFLANAHPKDRQLPEPWTPLQKLCDDLPETLSGLDAAAFRQHVLSIVKTVVSATCGSEDGVPSILEHLQTSLSFPQQMHLYHLSTMVLNAYAWCAGETAPPSEFPHPLSTLVCAAARTIGTQPIVTHATVVLYNCIPTNTWEEVRQVEDLDTLHTFTGGQDEKWFYLVTAMIELEAVPALSAMQRLCRSHTDLAPTEIIDLLNTISSCLRAMKQQLKRMPDHCRPTEFYVKLRPFLAGWKHNDAVPDGIVYANVDDQSRHVSGASAAQSTAVAAFDAFVGTEYAPDHFLVAMRQFMPGPHRDLLHHIAKQSASVRQHLSTAAEETPEIATAYDSIVSALHCFRTFHMQIVTRFIVTPARAVSKKTSLAEKGTGGTNLMQFLKSVREASDHTQLT